MAVAEGNYSIWGVGGKHRGCVGAGLTLYLIANRKINMRILSHLTSEEVVTHPRQVRAVNT